MEEGGHGHLGSQQACGTGGRHHRARWQSRPEGRGAEGGWIPRNMSEDAELSKYGAASVGCHSRALSVALTHAGRRPSPPDAWAAVTGAQTPGEVLRGQGREKGSCRKPGGREVPSGHRGQPTRRLWPITWSRPVRSHWALPHPGNFGLETPTLFLILYSNWLHGTLMPEGIQ